MGDKPKFALHRPAMIVIFISSGLVWLLLSNDQVTADGLLPLVIVGWVAAVAAGVAFDVHKYRGGSHN